MVKIEVIGAGAVALEVTGLSRRLQKTIIPQIIAAIATAIEYRIKTNLTNRILNVKTGELHKAPASKVHLLGADTYAFVVMRNNFSAPYQRIHEYGGMAGRNHSVRLRARKYMQKSFEQIVKGRSSKADKMINAIMNRHIK